jgi:hypothetical protein
MVLEKTQSSSKCEVSRFHVTSLMLGYCVSRALDARGNGLEYILVKD